MLKDILPEKLSWERLSQIKKMIIKGVRDLPDHLDRRHLVFIHDILMCALALPLTFWITTGEDFSLLGFFFILKHTLVFMLVSACIFLWLQLYRGMWRYVSPHEILATIFAAGYASALYFPLMALMSTSFHVPRSAIFSLFLITSFLLLSSRITYRFTSVRWFDDNEHVYRAIPRSRVLLLGSPQEISRCMQEFNHFTDPTFFVLGALTSQEEDVGRFIEGIEILGTAKDLKNIVKQFNLEGKHPHHIVLLGHKTDNLQTLKKLVTLMPGLGLDLMRFSEDPKVPFTLKSLSYKDFTVTDRPQTKTFSPLKETARAQPSQNILIFGASHQIGEAFTRKLLLEDNKKVFLADVSTTFLSTFQNSQKAQGNASFDIFPLSGTSKEDFSETLENANPDLVIAVPPITSKNFFEASPARSIHVIRRFMFSMLEACLSLNIQKIIILLPLNKEDFNYSALVRYFSVLEAEMCQHLSVQNSKAELLFLYTGDFAESEESLLSQAKSALEKSKEPIIRESLTHYEFSSLESLAEKTVSYLNRFLQESMGQTTHDQLSSDMTSSPEELLEQIKALYPLPRESLKLSFQKTKDPLEPVKMTPFQILRSEKTGAYSVKNRALLNNFLSNIKEYVNLKDDKKVLELLS